MPSFSRRRFLRTTLAGAAATVLLPGGATAQPAPAPAAPGTPALPAKKPNVLFIAVDDLRPQLGCYGAAKMHSPNLDRLAAGPGGMAFTQAFCQQAICAASRSSLLSGCRPDTTKVFDLETPLRTTMPDVLTLPQAFKQAGYTAISLGKIYHHGKNDDPAGWSQDPWMPPAGFPGYATVESRQLAQKHHQEALAAGWKPRGPADRKRGPAYEMADLPESAYGDGQIAAKAIEKLRELKGQPFFFGVGFLKPHLPFVCPKQYWDLYPAESIALADNPFAPKGAPPLALQNSGELRAYYGIPATGPIPDEIARVLIRGYYACVSFTDAMIGKVLAELDRQGLAENTIVVVWGDHGWHLGDHGLWCKHSNFETATHAPMIWRVPGAPGKIAGGTPCPALTEFVDIYPTLCELCGLAVPAHCEGTSLAPLFAEPQRPWKKAAFSQYPRGPLNGIMGHSLRTQRHRFTRWANRNTGRELALELYDHQTDPEENENLAGQPEHAETVRELKAMLQAGWKAARPG